MDGNRIVVAPPEQGGSVVIVPVGTATDAAAAVATAWKQVDPAFARELLTSFPQASPSWDEVRSFSYKTSPDEQRDVFARAARAGDQWVVMIVDSSDQLIGRRGAAFNQILDSAKPKDFVPETFAGRPPLELDAARIAELRRFLEESAKELRIPGIGYALIQNDKIIAEGGVGVRQLGRPEPVDAHTRFMIASNTKSMATLLLAKAVGEGRIGWDDPVTKAYPAFRLGSPETTAKTKIRHLVCACTGLPRKDLEWLLKDVDKVTANDSFVQLAATQPTSGFGEVYQYNNLMASAAGYVAAHLYYPKMEIGAAFDKAIQVNVFDPLGMKETDFRDARRISGNVAAPHADDLDARATLIGQDENALVKPYRPAGGAWSSAHDMALYTLNELRGGRLPNGKQMADRDALLERRVPGVATGEGRRYGMGLSTTLSSGIEVVHHGGSLFGYKSDFMFIPAAGIGAVILINSDNGRPLLDAFRRRLLEVTYGGKSNATAMVSAARARFDAGLAAMNKEIKLPADSAATTALASRYVHPTLGTLSVERGAAGVEMDWGTMTSLVGTRTNADGTLSFVTSSPQILGLALQPGKAADGARTLTIRDPQHEYVYREAAR
jgi:CubicO group peptidase (beta-lactamase class C family)